MNSKRVFFMMIALVVLSLSGIGAAVVYGNKMLEQNSQELLSLKVDNKALEQQQTSLIQADKDIVKYSDLEEITQSIVPQDKDQARAVREVVQLASESGIKLKSITFPASSLGTTGATGQSTAKSTISQAVPVTGIEGLYSLEMNIVPENKVAYYQFIDFLSKLEKNRRTALVTHISIDPTSADSKNTAISFSLTVNIFIKP